MSRITKWDEVRECYVIDPDSTQNHIQRLGELEDKDEVKEIEAADNGQYICPTCRVVKDGGWWHTFCPICGQRLREG